ELCALGKGTAWAWDRGDAAEQRIGLLVDELAEAVAGRKRWVSRLEGLLGRHWPEASAVVKLGGSAVLRALAEHGGPAGLAADGGPGPVRRAGDGVRAVAAPGGPAAVPLRGGVPQGDGPEPQGAVQRRVPGAADAGQAGAGGGPAGAAPGGPAAGPPGAGGA